VGREETNFSADFRVVLVHVT